MDSGNEKYAVMASAPDVRVGEGEYVNRLVRNSALSNPIPFLFRFRFFDLLE